MSRKSAGEPTAMTLAFIEAQRRAQENQPKEKVMDQETKSHLQRAWEYLRDEGEPRDVPTIAKAVEKPPGQTSAMMVSLFHKGYVQRAGAGANGLMRWEVVPGLEPTWGTQGGGRGRPRGVKDSKPRKARHVSQVVTRVPVDDRKIMRALPGGPTISVAGYIFTVAEAKEIFKAMKELFE